MIWSNVWGGDDPGMAIEEDLEAAKTFISSIYSYTFGETIVLMNISSEGRKFVYHWGKWSAKLTEDGDELVIPVHHVFEFVDNKIVFEYGFWDNLPIYLAQQALETEDI